MSLVLPAAISMERTEENGQVISKLIQNVSEVDEVGKRVSVYIETIWSRNRFLPVLIPDTYYSIALDRIKDWESNYPR